MTTAMVPQWKLSTSTSIITSVQLTQESAGLEVTRAEVEDKINKGIELILSQWYSHNCVHDVLSTLNVRSKIVLRLLEGYDASRYHAMSIPIPVSPDACYILISLEGQTLELLGQLKTIRGVS